MRPFVSLDSNLKAADGSVEALAFNVFFGFGSTAGNAISAASSQFYDTKLSSNLPGKAILLKSADLTAWVVKEAALTLS